MPDFVLRATGARFSEAAMRGRIESGAASFADFASADTPDAPLGSSISGSAPLEPHEESIHLPTGARFSGPARVARIETRLARSTDFVRVGAAPPPPPAAPDAAPAAPAPAASASPDAPPPEGFLAPGGLRLTPAAAVNHVGRGLSTWADLQPIYPTATGPSGPPPPPVPRPTDFPISPDQFTKRELVDIATALGLDTDGAKDALASRINDNNDPVGTAAAIAALRG